MNEEAQTLGLTGTTYVDVTGLSSDDVSTPLDQARLAVLLMKSPLVRSIVDQTSVTLPFAGVEDSFTPDVGIDNVIGVKSGRTLAAGGCDVMAMTFQDGTTDSRGLRRGARTRGRRPLDARGGGGPGARQLRRRPLVSTTRSSVTGPLASSPTTDVAWALV